MKAVVRGLLAEVKALGARRVLFQETARIALLITALNGLDVCAADIGNAYLNTPCKEKIWIIAEPEFGEKAVKPMMIGRV